MAVKRIFVAGHNGMVGSAIVRRLRVIEPDSEIVARTRDELDLANQESVNHFFRSEPVNQIYLAAAKVGGIIANNSYPAEFIQENLAIQTNVITAAYQNGVENLLFLGSSCIYPRDADQPMREDSLLTGPLESTNEPYAVAKIAGLKMCESYNRQYGVDYRSVMPTNLYGQNDNFHSQNSHVLPALIRRFHEAKLEGAKRVVMWGTGRPKREFMHVDDMADASVHVMNVDRESYRACTEPALSHINLGTGEDVTILELGGLVATVVGFTGKIEFDPSKPDGTPRKLLDVTKLHDLGWQHSIELLEGIRRTYDWFLENQEGYRA